MVFRFFYSILFVAIAAFAQGDSLSLSPAPGSNAGAVTLNLSLQSSAGQQPAGIQWTINYSNADFAAIQVKQGPSAAAADKAVDCAGPSTAYICLVAGVNSTNIPDGVIAVITLTVSPTTHNTSSLIQVQNAMAVSGDGTAIPITGTEITATIKSTGGSSAVLFTPVFPCRIADTRDPSGTFGGPSVNGGTMRDFLIPDSACGIPPSAAAYSLNVAVVPKHKLGFLTVWPAGQTRPTVATLNSTDGRIKSNAAIVAAGASGAISVYTTDTTDVILDINGYWSTSSADGLAFYALTPCRIADTRNTPGPVGGPALGAQKARAFPIAGGPCAIPDGAPAYSLNFGTLPEGPLGFLTAWPYNSPKQPMVASLNAVTGTATANAVIVPAGANGEINIFSTNATNLFIDTNGYFAAPAAGGLSLHTLAPCRVLDTRLNDGSPFKGTKEVPVSGTCGVPSTAQAYILNATVVPHGSFGFLSLWKHAAAQPLVSTLNAFDGAITSNMAIVPAAGGAIDAFASDPTHLILDIFGYFAP